jgi:hypothetical protein
LWSGASHLAGPDEATLIRLNHLTGREQDVLDRTARDDAGMDLDESDWRPEEAGNDPRWRGWPALIYAVAMAIGVGALGYAAFVMLRAVVTFFVDAFS